jgi:hypothetical protein
MTASPSPSLAQLIDPYEGNLLGLARRLFLMEAFTADLDRVTRLKPFRFRSEPIWLLMLDTRDMLVIHLASWARSIVDPDGLLVQLQRHRAGDLPRQLPPEAPRTANEPEWVTRSTRERREREHSESFDSLFPSAGACPKGSDFEGLRQTFRTHVKPVKDDRNWNRAHPFETVGGTTKMLNIAELRNHMDYAERFMNDIRMVGLHSTMHYIEMNSPNAADVAPDLVDAMLIGDPDRLIGLRDKSSRDDLYDRLHAEHEARKQKEPKEDDLFNDVWMPPPLPMGSAGT